MTMLLTFLLTTALYATWFVLGVRWLGRNPELAKSAFEMLVRVFGPRPDGPRDVQ
jgi:peptidoglycan/xylan/chitin deacetylase (PgdA/CDA1 family)